MRVAYEWTQVFPATWEAMRQLLSLRQVTPRKLIMYHAYWADMPKFNM